VAHLVVFVLGSLEQCSSILEAWETAGAPGITILESTGLQRIRGVMRDDLPLIPSLSDLLSSQELRHRTLFTVVPEETDVERIISATEKVVGGFNRHHAGFLFVVPVSRVLGLEKRDD
jgi:nitrogen regulatory protein PII